jgi:HEPN domain-containing protein
VQRGERKPQTTGGVLVPYLWVSFSIPFEVYMKDTVDVTFEVTEGVRARVRLRPPAPGDRPFSVVDEVNSTWIGMKQEDIVTAEHFTRAEVWFAPPWGTDCFDGDRPDEDISAAWDALMREGPGYVVSIVNHLLHLAAPVSRQYQLRPLVTDDIRDWGTGEAKALDEEPLQRGLMFTPPRSNRPPVLRALDEVLPEIRQALEQYHAVPVWQRVRANAEWLNGLGQYDAAIVVSHVALEMRLNALLTRLSQGPRTTLGGIVKVLCRVLFNWEQERVRVLEGYQSEVEALRGPAAHGGGGREEATWATWPQVRQHLDTAQRMAEYCEAACSRRDQ